ncbi:Syntaxin-6_N domain-containing protein [Cephalotus follicularis]|uniref:Syntaxin-6_N domain-containing protein n=1 Tax=Cephalotus follicularis TaxID=3775 RepID=A0A1Q3CWH2_CEPFO|nr:Syntaxin-6_N domain-containing protein [Cephalotus follicularis]
MASSFDRWEKDPFFSAAEEVQESADRMESTYRTWIHSKKDASSMWNFEELGRDLRTALGTTKWQLEEFGKAVRLSYLQSSNDDRDRHQEFMVAIGDQISKIENSLRESGRTEGKASLPWVRLDEGECNELALFLSGPSTSEDNKTRAKNHVGDNELLQQTEKEPPPVCSKNSSHAMDWGSLEAREEKSHGHRRTASASADIGSCKIAILDDGYHHSSSNVQPPLPPRKIPSVSGFLNSMESAALLKWPKNGVRKWKATDRHQESDTELLRIPLPTKGTNAWYERSKCCLDNCDDCCDKPIYGWYGAIQRQVQRSQYQMQYGRPAQVTIWVILFLCLIVLIALCAI